MSSNVNTTGPDVNVTVTESINDAIFKALSRIENNQNEMKLMMEHMPMADGVNDGVSVEENWEKSIRAAVTIACRRHRFSPGQVITKKGVDNHNDIVIETVIAILKGQNDNR